ncbi:MAG TPA: choice-of-anchor B family protein [Vicinamibacterales bacterium]|nr:choice-of-anchor B family protein [Vicinamibacterales bacterium]
MRSSVRFVLCGAAFALAFLSARIELGARVPAELAQFGGAVLVGDGEVFAGESANQFRPGTVYVYRKNGPNWMEAAQIVAPKSAVGDGFGASLAMDGSTLYIGAGTSAVHVFTKRNGNWTFASTIDATVVPMPPAPPAPAPANPPPAGAPAPVPAPNVARFGAITAAGDWLLIGKDAGRGGRGIPVAQAGGGRGGPAPVQPAGAVWAFKRGANGEFAYHSTIASTADAAATAGDRFGSSVALSGTMALIGASGQNAGAGVVHEFGLDGDAWKSVRTFAPNGAQGTTAAFGSVVAINGPQAVVTAPGDSGGYGAVYVFGKQTQQAGRGGGPPPAAGTNAPVNIQWVEMTRLAAPAAGRADRFGTSIAASDREVLVGAPGAAGAGRVFVFNGGATGFQIDGLRLLGPAWTDPIQAGNAISLRGNVAAVGATGANRGGGGLLIYERDAFGSWREQPMMTTPLDELPAITGGERKCGSTGKVEVFDCAATDLQSFLPPSYMTPDGHYIGLSSLWGWTDSVTKTEWALVGLRDGTTFVDITNATQPRAVAYLPMTDGARATSWREMKTYKDHAFIVSDGAGPHGIQIFDMTRLRTMKPQPNGRPWKVEADLIYRDVNSVHDMVLNEESGFAYAVGSSGGGNSCSGALHMIDVRSPKEPKFVGCFADTESGRARNGYIHDALCVNYKGPDKRYKGHEICIGSNETMLSLQDVTDKKAPKVISRGLYPKIGYTHQGWLTEDHKYFYLDDELDETGGMVDKTRTLIWDFSDMENPKLVKEYFSKEAASDHNQYVKGDYLYQSNYRAGLRVLNIKDPVNPKEVAYFDTDPFRPNTPGFNGAWNIYPFFKSGSIIISSIEQGLFVVKTEGREK